MLLKECANVFYKFRTLNRTGMPGAEDDRILCIGEYFLKIVIFLSVIIGTINHKRRHPVRFESVIVDDESPVPEALSSQRSGIVIRIISLPMSSLLLTSASVLHSLGVPVWVVFSR